MEQASSFANIIPFSPPSAVTARPAATGRKKLPSDGILRNAVKILYSIWENSNEGMRLTDENGLVIAANPSFSRLVGLRAEEMVGTHFSAVFADVENREKMARVYESHFQARQPEPINERRYVLWTNQTIDVEVCDSFVETDDGRTLLLSRFRDVTSEKLTQNALAESESKYRGLFANSVMPMFQSSVDGKLLNANRAMLKLLGYSSFYELADLDIARDTYCNPDDRHGITETLRQKGFVVNAEIKLKRKNGNIITVLENARALHDEGGNVVGYEGLLEDITARKAMEKKLQEYVQALESSKNALAELNAQKDKLFSILSHDLRSPFSSILGFCDILLKEYDQVTKDDQLQFIGYIQEAAQDQLVLVNKLLDWSRIESGRIKFEQSELDLHDIVQKSVNSLMGLAHQKQIKLHSSLPVNVRVRGDRQILTQVFVNLLGNSLKFTHAAGTVSVELAEERPEAWVIGVRDTGIGIPEEDLHKLFKVEEKYTRKGLQGERGTGLGLPMVFEIIQKHHGSIEVNSSVGLGTLFLITMPKCGPTPGDVILLVDTDRGVHLLHSRSVKRLVPEANILHATDGAEAIETAKEQAPLLIIADADLPDLQTAEFLRRLKSDTHTREIPVLVVASHPAEDFRCELKRAGALDVLPRPMTSEHLSEAIRHLEFFTKHSMQS